MRSVAAVGVAVVFLLPLVLLVTGSLRSTTLAPPRGPELLPRPLAFENYGRAFELVDLGRYALNSLVVAAIAVPLTLLVASWAGFALSQVSARIQRAVVAASFAALMVPLTALMVPRFAIFRALGLVDTWAPLIAPALIGTSPFYVLVYWWAFRRLPREALDAARVDGAGPFTLWRRVALPLVRPVTAAVAVLAFSITWSNFVDPLLYLFDESLYTLPLGVRSLSTLDRSDLPLMLAGAVVATAPALLALVPLHRALRRPLA